MIKLIKNYTYDNKYDYIKLHDTKTSQNDYFNSFQNILIDEGAEEGYIREGETFIIDYNYDYLVSEGINYVIWNNGFKDLYCFIIRKEYIDEEMTRLHYEIDVLNTFLFDITIKKSFVERKKCTISEITNFDEGLNIGEHTISQTVTKMDKQYKWFAMFNGIKQQQLTFENNKLTGVSTLPSPTMKPLTIIDGIQYPLHFMELETSYPEPTYTLMDTDGSEGGGSVGGDWRNGIISSSGFRFIKGYEGFAPSKYQDSGGYWTIAYGVTAHGEPNIYNDLVSKSPITEQMGAEISFNLKNTNYGNVIKNLLIVGGITEQYQFDALLSLSYNCGVGTITGSGYHTDVWEAIKKDPTNENYIRTVWENFKITSNGIPLEGLRLRRIQECNMFFNKKYEVRKISTINVNGGINGYVTENDGNGWLPN
ncbi:glycoside hydrolase family protein [Romboutsia sp.]|uniref:glycoside hydrolase family protein n=1 Tax=Romboutsia sp. TaxID=1965302 RepID=UPI003F33A88E